MYIALDLETTGLDAENDKVIEVAAVLFEKGKIYKKFSKLVNPLCEIPEIVTHITGIKNEDLKDAPTLQEIQNELEQFIGNYPIVGHFISFDTNFLITKGVKVTGKELDTYLLAQLLMPGQSSYSLETITEKLNITHEDKHRALDDTLACIDLFNILMDKMEEIPEKTLKKVQYYLNTSEHPIAELFNQAKGSSQEPTKTQRSFEEHTKTTPIKRENVLAIYDNNELLKKIHPDYHKRESQVQMSSAILDAFEYQHHYIIEAGTGTGKSMAYLLPAIHKSLSENEKVVIATHTKTLQEQLIKKDIPELEEIVETLSKGERKLQACTLKGRNNYISKKRFEIFASNQSMTEAESIFASKIELWLHTTLTGDKEELNLQGEEYFMFLEISCQEGACHHDNHAYREGCYLLKARERAANADIVIVNHSLLALDLKIDNSLIPQYNYLIIDEAHHTEESFSDAYTKTFTLTRSLKPFTELSKSLSKITRNLKSSLFMSEDEVEDIKNAKEELDHLISKIEILFGLVGIFVTNQNRDEFNARVVLSEYTKSSQDWKKVHEAAESIFEDTSKILNTVGKLLNKDSSPEFSHNIVDIQKLITVVEIIKEWKINFVETFVETNLETNVTWAFEIMDGSLMVKQAPINIGNLLEEKLYSNKASIILSSATLSTNENFNFVRDRLNLGEHFEELMLESHFNYPDQVEIVVPSDLPNPRHPQYMSETSNYIREAIKKFDGHTLVLFTSKRAIETTYMALAPELKKEGFEIYAQGMSGGKGKILEKFKKRPQKRAIFGTNTFWEGVDIKGDDIKCVIIHKLPFDPPFDPVHTARSQKYMNSFAEYSIPRAVIRFKQGFGRLIRSESDTGTIFVLDSRVRTKEYGKIFIDSLPKDIIIKDKLEE